MWEHGGASLDGDLVQTLKRSYQVLVRASLHAHQPSPRFTDPAQSGGSLGEMQGYRHLSWAAVDRPHRSWRVQAWS
jgi:hypothetical protein